MWPTNTYSAKMCLIIRFSCFEFNDATLEPLKELRSGDEIRMHVNQPHAQLPIELNGENRLVPWGNKSHPRLPKTGFCKAESLKSGKWRWLNPQPVKILAAFGYNNGVWYQIREGIQGILIYDDEDQPHCFLLTQPATHYFKTMTGSERMPALINQVI